MNLPFYNVNKLSSSRYNSLNCISLDIGLEFITLYNSIFCAILTKSIFTVYFKIWYVKIYIRVKRKDILRENVIKLVIKKYNQEK